MLDSTNLTNQRVLPSSIFKDLPPAYFSPSTPLDILVSFQTHDGDLRPNPTDGSVPLDVSLYFVTLDDPLISRLSRRPVVLYNSQWVLECVRLGEKLRLGDWIVSSMPDQGMKYITSGQTMAGIQSDEKPPALIRDNITIRSMPTHYHRSTTPTPHQTSKGSRIRQIVAPRFLLDFDKNVTLNLGDNGPDIIATLATVPPFSETKQVLIPPDQPAEHYIGSKRRTCDAYQETLKKSRKAYFQTEFMPTFSSLPQDLWTRQHRSSENQDQNLMVPTPPNSSELGTPTEQMISYKPRKYLLKEVMQLLTELNRVSKGVEVVGVDWLRMEHK